MSGELTGLQLDLATVVARLEQIRDEGHDGHWLLERVVTCDLPRLSGHLSPAAAEALEAGQISGIGGLIRDADDITGRELVECDDSCGAFAEPVTLSEHRAALAHWRDHKTLNGCSHGY